MFRPPALHRIRPSALLFWRLVPAIVLFQLIFALVLAVSLEPAHDERAGELTLQSLRQQADIIESALRRLPAGDVRPFLDAASRGRWEMFEGSKLPGVEDSEVTEARADGSAFRHRPRFRKNLQQVIYARRVDFGGTPAVLRGRAFVTVPAPTLWGIAWPGGLTLAAAALTLLVFTGWILRRVVRPLERLTEAARSIAYLSVPDDVDDRDGEIARLEKALRALDVLLQARIAELQEQQHQLATNNEQLETVLGAMVEGVIAVDRDEKILLANEAAGYLLNEQQATLVKRPVWEVVRHPQIQSMLRETLQAQQSNRAEFQVPRTQRVVELVARPLPGAPSSGAVLVLHDVTELRRLESLRHEFVSNVSHELKTPLASIAAYTETLIEGAVDDPEVARRFLGRIAEQAERLHELILDLLKIARMESTEQTFDIQPLDPEPVIRASAAAHAQLAEAKRISLTVLPPPARTRASADEEGLRTILDNLVGNAVNYTPEGGAVTVAWREADGWVDIVVEDTGIGIPKDHLPRIFERFYRVDKARSREVGGTGLGLSIVKHLCQVFGGSVQVSSQVNQGTRLTVRLRAAESAAESAAVSAD